MNYCNIEIPMPLEEEEIFYKKRDIIEKAANADELTSEMLKEWQKYIKEVGEKYLKNK